MTDAVISSDAMEVATKISPIPDEVSASRGLNSYLTTTQCSETEFGWIAGGRLQENKNNNNLSCYLLKDDNSVEDTLKLFFELESLGIKDDPYYHEDDQAMNIFKETIQFNNGRYVVELPFRKNWKELSDNFSVAKQRFQNLWRSEELVSMKALLDHVESAHNIAIEKETKKFDTYEAFKIWKEDVEKQTTGLYVKNTGSKFNDMKKTTYFYCHRNGFYNARGDKKRTIKMAGSNKINRNCPSKMKVCEDNENQVYVEFTKTHLGHGKDLGRMQITREEKDELARKLEKKIPIEIILDGIRDSFIDRLERIHLVTRKDMLNLKAEYSISSEGIMDTNDVLSVGKWVHSLQGREDSPVILFKDQNIYDVLYPELKSEDFLLVIMNSCQREMLSFYGNDTICLDFTHGMNAYGFDLATILVLDDKREGFPAAFILSNRQDSKALSVAFAAIKEHVNISPKVMMTDDTESFLNSWRTVFGVPEKRLLCTWHVDRSWRKSDPSLQGCLMPVNGN
ncbi:uncharacterized protein NPIL_273371 [Nephila pilipes]|uniref:MULE transposase domain-containing protein n=1 Tax=Nephila pilipes TaxID=299642 RepID=A0A8X6TYZ3_NEPPI|nr:uncharacterized protein NPIL_273371 [Nephila pilipes]